MGIIDIVILVLLLLSVILGLIKGFSKKRITPYLMGISAFVAYMGGIPLSRALMNSSLGYDMLQGKYYELLPVTDAFTQSVMTDESSRITQFKSALSELKIPSFFQGMFISRVMDNTGSVATALASSFANLTLITICFTVIFLLCFIILSCIMKPIWNTIFGENGKGFVGRLFGALFTAFKTVALIIVVLWLVTLVDQVMLKYDNDTLHTFLVSDLSLEDTSHFSIGRFFYETASSFSAWIGG